MSSHQITAIPRPKMDTPTGLFTWECTCGRIGSMIGSEADALKAGESHRAAKEAVTPKGVAVLVEVIDELSGMRQAKIITPGDTYRLILNGILISFDDKPVSQIEVPVQISARIA